MHTDARIVGDQFGKRRALVADHVHFDAAGRQRVCVILHAGTPAEIPQNYDGGAHYSRGTGGYYNPARALRRNVTGLVIVPVILFYRRQTDRWRDVDTIVGLLNSSAAGARRSFRVLRS